MAEMLACSRGFLIERQEDGTFRPFFVKVREEDILWNDGSHDGGSGGGGGAGANINIKTLNGWLVETVNNEYITLSKPFTIDSVTFTRDANDDTKLVGNITLPYAIASESYFSANYALNGKNLSVSLANVKIEPVVTRSQIKNVIVTLQNLMYPMPYDWDRDVLFETSKIYLKVSGRSAS